MQRRIGLTWVALMVLVLASGCQHTSERDGADRAMGLQTLRDKIDRAQSGLFGEFMTEMHRAEVEMDRATAVHRQLTKDGKAGGKAADPGHAAAARALLHRDRAERALDKMLAEYDDEASVYENSERIAYLEAIHVEANAYVPTAEVYFAFGGHRLPAEERRKLARIVEFLGDYPLYSLRLVGYADSVGGKSHNLRLAQRRNRSVLRALRKMGLPRHALLSIAVGEANGPDETRNRENRRVEVRPYVHGRYAAESKAVAGNP